MRDPKAPVQFTPPLEELAKHYTPEQQEALALMEALKNQQRPVGGMPPVKIPPLNAEAITGRTMEEQAAILGDVTNPYSPNYKPEVAMSKGPFDVLPPSATQDPNFRPGVGSMLAGNQPTIAQPQQSYRPQLRPETVESIKALDKFQEQVQQVKQADPEAEKPKSDGQRDSYKELRDMLSEEQWSRLNNPDRKNTIESKLPKLNITDVFIHGELRQDVTITPDVVLTFRTPSTSEDLEIKRMMYGVVGSDRYLMDKYSIMQLTLALSAVNGEELPSHLSADKKFDEKKFLDKFEKITRFPIFMVADFGIQYLWFHERVEKLLVREVEELKNG
jgi:hypothetical protein